MTLEYYLSLGSNLSPEINLPDAVRMLGEFGNVIAVSSVIETPPVGMREPQPSYLNAAVRVASELSPLDFQKQAVEGIETALGRVRTEDKYAARTIDLDILLVDGQVLRIEHRPVPSPEILERGFVAVPLAEIAPEMVHPKTGETIAAIASRFDQERMEFIARPDVDLRIYLSDAG